LDKKKGKLIISRRYNLRTLASVRTWGSLEGADRMRLAPRKDRKIFRLKEFVVLFLKIYI